MPKRVFLKIDRCKNANRIKIIENNLAIPTNLLISLDLKKDLYPFRARIINIEKRLIKIIIKKSISDKTFRRGNSSYEK